MNTLPWIVVGLLVALAVAAAIDRLISWDIARRERRIRESDRESDERFARLVLANLATVNRLRLPRTSCPKCGNAPGVLMPGGSWRCGRCGAVHTK